jgi:hypothetical protein
MALPIAATPKLGVADTRIFLKRVERDLNKPVSRVPAFKIAEAAKFVKEYFENRQKQNY